MEYFNIVIKAIFIENLALSLFLGMCTFLALSKNIITAFNLGVAVAFIQTITVPLNYLLHEYVLKKNALVENLDLTYLSLLTFISLTAAVVQILEMILDKYFQSLYNVLGIYLPLITVNCAILGGSLLMVERNYNFAQSLAFGFGTGIGWAFAIIALASLRFKMGYGDIPKPLKGLGITFITAGFVAMAFMAFSGIDL